MADPDAAGVGLGYQGWSGAAMSLYARMVLLAAAVYRLRIGAD